MLVWKTIVSGETFSCPVCNRTYVWYWNDEENSFSFRCANGRPCKHVSFKFNHWDGFDPDFPATLIVRFVDWDKIRYLSIAGVFYVLTVLWSIAFAYFLPAGKVSLYTAWLAGVAGFGTGAGIFVGKAMAKK